jgi:hypothetical protein
VPIVLVVGEWAGEAVLVGDGGNEGEPTIWAELGFICSIDSSTASKSEPGMVRIPFERIEQTPSRAGDKKTYVYADAPEHHRRLECVTQYITERKRLKVL